MYDLIERVAHTEATVLIVGESGSGKELVANTIHRMSARAKEAFVAVNCGAIPATLIEAELFGYEKGAFTGAAKTHRGYLERASGGTLFLDEITEMPLEMQVRLLRVLETGSFCRVGGDQEIRAGARIMAATNRDPATAVADNRLREDLMYRLAVFPINLPPLRTRGEDVELLARHFLSDLNHEAGSDKVFSSASLELLRTHPWPGNVRELKNCVQRAFILADEQVELKELAPAVRSALAEHGCSEVQHRHLARGDGAQDHLRHPGALQRQQAPRRRGARREPQDPLQPPGRVFRPLSRTRPTVPYSHLS